MLQPGADLGLRGKANRVACCRVVDVPHDLMVGTVGLPNLGLGGLCKKSADFLPGALENFAEND